MKSKAQLLQEQLEKTRTDLIDGKVSPALASAVARLADAEIRSVVSEIRYRESVTSFKIPSIGHFE